jgi:hypothetical protein
VDRLEAKIASFGTTPLGVTGGAGVPMLISKGGGKGIGGAGVGGGGVGTGDGSGGGGGGFGAGTGAELGESPPPQATNVPLAATEIERAKNSAVRFK